MLCGEAKASPEKCFTIALDLLRAGFMELTAMMIAKSLNLMPGDEREMFLGELKSISNRE